MKLLSTIMYCVYYRTSEDILMSQIVSVFFAKSKSHLYDFRRTTFYYFKHLCRFLMCIETESSFSRSSLKTDCLPLYINLRHRSCSLFILLFIGRLWDIHIRQQQQQKREFKKAFTRNFLFDKSMYGATRVNGCTFPLSFIQTFDCDIQNKRFH